MFCANKGYSTPLYTFLEKYFQNNGYTRIMTFVDLNSKNTIRKLNFWYAMGFSTYQTEIPEFKIHLHKYI